MVADEKRPEKSMRSTAASSPAYEARGILTVSIDQAGLTSATAGASMGIAMGIAVSIAV